MKNKNYFFRIIFVMGIVIALVASNANAEDLQELLKLVKNHPEIGAIKHKTDAVKMTAFSMAALPDPLIAIGINKDNVLNKDTRLNLKPMLMAEQEVPFPGKRVLRIKLGENEADIGAFEQQALIAKKQKDLVQIYFELFILKKEVQLNREFLRHLKVLEEAAEALLKTGKTEQLDLLKIKADSLAFRARNTKLEGEFGEKEAGLKFNIKNVSERELFLEIPEELPLPSLQSADRVEREAFEKSPLLLFQKAELKKLETEEDLAVREAYPDFMFSGELADLKMWGFKAGLKVPIYWNSKQKNQLNSVIASKNAGESELEGMKLMLRAEINERTKRADASLKNLEFYRNELMPHTEIILKAAITAYSTGKFPFLMLRETIFQMVENKREYYGLLSDYNRLYWELELLAKGTL